MEILRDPRIPFAMKMMEGMVAKVDWSESIIMITRDNTLVIISRETVMSICKIENAPPVLTDIVFRYKDHIIYEVNENKKLEENQYISSPDVTILQMYNYYTKYTHIENNKQLLVAYDNELRGKEEFEKLISMKSVDGMKFFKIIGLNHQIYFVPIFYGFPSINQKDKIGINIYSEDYKYLIIVFTIFKKKINKEFKSYHRTLNINYYNTPYQYFDYKGYVQFPYSKSINPNEIIILEKEK